jgi:hypothetical protein
MRAELKSLDSLDVDLRSHVPDDEDFCISVTAQIGTIGGHGADCFDFEVCSPKWLELALETDTVVSGRHKLFMSTFSYEALEAYVVKRVHQAEGPDWPSVAEKLSRWGHWEFEDYQR